MFGDVYKRQPVDKMIFAQMVINSMLADYPYDPGEYFSSNVNEIIVEREIFGKKVRIFLHGFVKAKDGYYVFTYNGMEKISEGDFIEVIEDQVNYLKDAAQYLYSKFESVSDSVLNRLEREYKDVLKDGVSIKDILDDSIAGYGIKVRDALFLPDIELADILPEEYHFTPIPSLGVTYLNTGIVGINPVARIADYITGKPIILAHELEHNTKKIQNLPLRNMVEVELWASLPMFGYLTPLEFTFHSYLESVRDISLVMFNWDAESEFRKTIYPLITGIRFDKQRIKIFMDKLNRVSEEIERVAFNEYFPEFFSNPLYWMSVSKWLDDEDPTRYDEPSFRIFFYIKYEPTCIDGVETTHEFLKKHKNVVYKLAKDALEKLDNSKSDDQSYAEYIERFREDPRYRYMLGLYGLNNLSDGELLKTIKDLYNLGLIRVPIIPEEMKR